jgi:hypothetical protein
MSKYSPKHIDMEYLSGKAIYKGTGPGVAFFTLHRSSELNQFRLHMSPVGERRLIGDEIYLKNRKLKNQVVSHYSYRILPNWHTVSEHAKTHSNCSAKSRSSKGSPNSSEHKAASQHIIQTSIDGKQLKLQEKETTYLV